MPKLAQPRYPDARSHTLAHTLPLTSPHNALFGLLALLLHLSAGCAEGPPSGGTKAPDSADLIAATPDVHSSADTHGNSTTHDASDHQRCPTGSVCGGDEPLPCHAPFEFVADPNDTQCTPVAYCPAGAVCGGSTILRCNPTREFPSDPTHAFCQPIDQCPGAAQCNAGEEAHCSVDCSASNYRITEATAPTRDRPWEPERDTARVTEGRLDWKAIEELRPHPALMALHPGYLSVPGPLPAQANPVSKTVTVRASYAGRSQQHWYSTPNEPAWRSTGLFAAPGTVVTVALEGLDDSQARAFLTQGFELQIGTHRDTDLVWSFPFGQPIRRFPEIIMTWPVQKALTAINSPFGGLIYLRVPAGTQLGPVDLTITGAYEAPYYVHGETSEREWQDTMRHHPAPWAELVGEKIVLTVPSSEVRELDPIPLMNFWHDAMNASWLLAGYSGAEHRIERIVADPAIEGIAHSGYPIAMAEAWVYGLVDSSELTQNAWWTTFHELGHNFQWAAWTFEGLQEATCNLWSLYVLETVAGLPWDQTHADAELGPVKRDERIRAYIDQGRNFAEDWQGGFFAYQGFLPLEPFLQLQEAFGWEFFIALNARYLALPETDSPNSSHDKIQRWIVLSSEETGRNLEAFYRDWGFPIDAATAEAIAQLPAWEANPMTAYLP